jgi:hypothetical protein
MPLAAGNLVVTTFGRNIYVVLGTYTVPGLIAAFRCVSLCKPSAQIFLLNTDVDLSSTAFVLVGAAVPAGSPPIGSRVQIQESPLALFAGAPVTTFPITQPGPRGIVAFYVTIPPFATIYAVVVEPDQNLVLAQRDELSLAGSNPYP